MAQVELSLQPLANTMDVRLYAMTIKQPCSLPRHSSAFLGAFRIANEIDPLLRWVYPLLQPAARALIGVWLWKQVAVARV
jgi:hypothetical protein